jgi:hypothetical protein
MVVKRKTKTSGPHPRAKLTDAEVEEIREMWSDGLWTYSTLAKVWDVSRYTIRDIVTGRRR